MPIDNEAEYNNSARVPEVGAILDRWVEASEQLRGSADCRLDSAYGPHPRQRYDLFRPPGSSGREPIAVFIHGGYWQWRDRKDFSFSAAGALAHGVTWAIPSYRQCPEVRIADIIADLVAFHVHLWRETGQRPVVAGHSAGGHLTAAMLATDWAAHGAPADLVRMGYAISGVFELAPLVGTTIAAGLGETTDSAMQVSPRFGPVPPRDRWLTAAVGAHESDEFIRQSVDMAGTWAAAGLATEAVIIPQTNHFTVIDGLADPHCAMVQRIADMARRCAAPKSSDP